MARCHSNFVSIPIDSPPSLQFIGKPTSNFTESTSLNTKQYAYKETNVSHTAPPIKFRCLTYFTYNILVICCGALEPLGGSLYNQFEAQLNTSATNIAYMLSLKPIVSGIAALITAWVLDKFADSHYYIATMSIVTAIAISLLPQLSLIWQMYFVFVIIGYCIGTVMVTYPVYILRLYPNNGRALFALMAIYGISKTVTPIMIQLSIETFGSYSCFIYVICILFVIEANLLFCLQTPSSESISREFDEEDTKSVALSPSTRLFHSGRIQPIPEQINTDKRLIRNRLCLYALLILIEFCFSALQSGTVNFVQKYVTDDLHQDPQIARYLISSYYFGQLLYRVIVAIFFQNVDPIRSVLTGNIMLVIFGLLYAIYGNMSLIDDDNVWLLYVIFISIGIWASPIFPGIIKWTEEIQSLTGLMSGIIIISFSVADASTVTTIGHLIAAFGANIIPFPILGYIVFCLILTIFARCMNSRYCRLRNNVDTLVGLIQK